MELKTYAIPVHLAIEATDEEEAAHIALSTMHDGRIGSVLGPVAMCRVQFYFPDMLPIFRVDHDWELEAKRLDERDGLARLDFETPDASDG